MKTLILTIALSLGSTTFASETNEAIADCPKFKSAIEHLNNMGFYCSQTDLQSEVIQDQVQAELICANKGDATLAEYAKLSISGTLNNEADFAVEALNIHFFGYSE